MLRQILGPDAGLDVGSLEDLLGDGGADPIHVAKRDINALVRRYFNTNDAWHIRLTLALFMARVSTNNTNHTLTPDYFALLAHAFN